MPVKHRNFALLMYTLKKSLGQHFLRDENIARKIVETLRQRSFNRLLEVGPGGGALTKLLIGIKDIDFRAVELDEEKVRYLLTNWPVLEGQLIHGSILDIESPWKEPFTVIGNFPYNISSQILFRMLDWRQHLQTMVGMFQKEVAQRVAAGKGSKTYGVLSVLIQAFFTVENLFEVHEQCFNPPPKVKSAVIRLTPRPAPAFRDEKSFFLLVKTAFNQRRKTLRNAIRPLFDEAALKDAFFDKRAEQLSVEDFAALTWKMR